MKLINQVSPEFSPSRITHGKKFPFILLIVAVVLMTQLYVAFLPVQKNYQPNDLLQETGALEKTTYDEAHIGMTGGGNIAYFIDDRTIINLDGLINSLKYFRALKTGKANDFIDEMKIDYIYGNEYMITKSDPYGDIFQGHLEKVKNTSITGNFTLYRYNPNK